MFHIHRPVKARMLDRREMSELELFVLYVMVLERSLKGYDPEQQFYDWVNEISTLIT